MNYSTRLCLLLTTLVHAKLPTQATPGSAAESPPLEEALRPVLRQLLDLVEGFRSHPATPTTTRQFEQKVELQVREVARQLVQHTYNSLEPTDVGALPKHLHFPSLLFTRLNRKTPQNVWTLFGQIRLRRVGYRNTCDTGEPTLFPLAVSLGLIEGASPALASHAGTLLASAGMTQGLVRQHLRRHQGVGWGVKKLRQFLQAMAERMADRRHDSQVAHLLALLEQAAASRGKHKPVLSVGRDGITLGIRIKKGSLFEVATTATVTVYDRRGKRLGTVYLAYSPQPEQRRMSQELTRLLTGVLEGWQGVLPRLCYVTDAGKSETGYYQKVLSRMRHPRTQERLAWIRVVDYYHASTRLWTMAASLLGKGRGATAWVRKMQKWLLKPGGVNRVLHSAAAYRVRSPLEGERKKAFEQAYQYLRRRMKYLRYEEYRRQGLPIGSGVTEAGCKTVYTQRLKLSGMRWGLAGSQRILDLRVLLLSGVWDKAFQSVLETMPVAKVPTREAHSPDTPVIAA